jgi:hypothetical protein
MSVFALFLAFFYTLVPNSVSIFLNLFFKILLFQIFFHSYLNMWLQSSSLLHVGRIPCLLFLLTPFYLQTPILLGECILYSMCGLLTLTVKDIHDFLNEVSHFWYYWTELLLNACCLFCSKEMNPDRAEVSGKEGASGLNTPGRYVVSVLSGTLCLWGWWCREK